MLARCFSPSSGEQTRNGATHLGSRAETPFRDTFFSPRHSLRARERRTHPPSLSLPSQVQRRPDGRAAHRTHTCVNADNSPTTVEEAARCALTQYAFLSGYLICLPVCPRFLVISGKKSSSAICRYFPPLVSSIHVFLCRTYDIPPWGGRHCIVDW